MKSNFFKSTAFIVFLLSSFLIQTKAQNAQIYGIAGYLMNGDVTVAEGELIIDNNFSYGFGVDIEVEKYMQAELSWTTSASSASLEEYLGTTRHLTDINIHHFQAGALVEPEKKKVSPFALLTMGATLFSPTEQDPVTKTNYEDEWRFSISLGGGFKVYVSDRIGLRFQGRLILPMQFTSGSIYVGSGGSGVAVGSYTFFAEGDFSGGIFIRL